RQSGRAGAGQRRIPRTAAATTDRRGRCGHPRGRGHAGGRGGTGGRTISKGAAKTDTCHPITLFTGPLADLPLEEGAPRASWRGRCGHTGGCGHAGGCGCTGGRTISKGAAMTDTSHPITLFTGQWADLPFEEVARLAASWGYDGLEIACSGDHLDLARADEDPD